MMGSIAAALCDCSLFEAHKNIEYDDKPYEVLENERTKVEKPLTVEPKASDEYEDIYNDITLIKCRETITYISKSKVMVIMKGLPGSGKSTIVKALAKKYPNSVICSADHFFGRGKRYKFDAQKLSLAHAECKRDAVDACQKSQSPIVIDNTNVQQWEMKFYIQLADVFNYFVVVLEPHTPWSKDAQILAKKNSHGVEMTVLKKKLKMYETISPLYFGWFLNEGDSFAVSEKTIDWLKKSMQVPQFQNDFEKRTNASSVSELVEHFSGGSYPLQGFRLLHCTSRYTAKRSQDFLENYVTEGTVKKTLGRVTTLSIVGFLVTPKTLGARVVLSKEQMALWAIDNDDGDDERRPGKGKRRKRFYGPPQKPQDIVKIPSYTPEPSFLREQSALGETPQQDDDRMKACLSPARSRRPHVTLGTAKGFPPVTTGIELMQLLDEENGLDLAGTKYSISGATLRNHGNGFWGIYPNFRIVMEALFNYQL